MYKKFGNSWLNKRRMKKCMAMEKDNIFSKRGKQHMENLHFGV